jgi:membrane-associated phospholipid phosphatase
LLAALASLLALAVTFLFAYHSNTPGAHETAALRGFVGLNRPHVAPLADHAVHLADPRSYMLLALALVAIALAAGRRRVAVAIPLVAIATGFTAETLKLLIDQPRASEWLGRHGAITAQWPSGHSTAAMTIALLAVLAVPARWRLTAAAVGGAFAVAVGYSLLVLGWHLPADVVGGYLVAAAWTLIALAALNGLERRWPSRERPQDAPLSAADRVGPLALAAAAGAAAVALIAARPQAVLGYLFAHPSFVVGALVIATLAFTLAGAMARGLRAD